MLTAKQFAEAIQRPYTTVMGWLQAEIVPGAQLVESPIGNYYEIPADIVGTFEPPKRGRPSKTPSGQAEQAETEESSLPSEKQKPAKKTSKK